MDFAKIIPLITKEFQKEKVEYALIGGFAMGAIGLKIQASVNNQERESREYFDIKSIMEYYRLRLDWNLLEEYFNLFQKGKEFKTLKERYGKID